MPVIVLLHAHHTKGSPGVADRRHRPGARRRQQICGSPNVALLEIAQSAWLTQAPTCCVRAR